MVKKPRHPSPTCHCRDTETVKFSFRSLLASFEYEKTKSSKSPSKPIQTHSSKPSLKRKQKVSPTHTPKLTIGKVSILVLLLVISIPLLNPSIQFIHWALPFLHAQYTDEQLPLLYEYTLNTILEIIRIVLARTTCILHKVSEYPEPAASFGGFLFNFVTIGLTGDLIPHAHPPLDW